MSMQAQRERIEDEASLWAARLDGGGMTDADRAALDAWLAGNPEHRWVLSRYRQLSAELDDQLGTAAESLVAREAAVRRRRWRAASVVFAAAAALAFGFFVFGGAREVVTHTGERHVASLEDGSRVELNAQTDLRVDFSRRERRVRLVRGEALFHVAADPARPFFVETPAGVVRVTGTVFNVRAASEARVEVTVLEGHVRVRATSEPVADGEAALTAGRQARMNGGRVEVRTLPEGAAQDVIAWRDGQAVFVDTPLADALERFAAYHARTIRVEPDAADLRLGGRFALDDLDGLLEAVQRVLPVRAMQAENGAVRIARVK